MSTQLKTTAAPTPLDDQAILRSALDSMTRHLHDELVPFWSQRALDPEHGGYLTNFDGGGQALATSEKYLNTQCRLLWWFATLSRQCPQIAGSRQLADAGFDLLLRHFWDAEHGGWFWKLKRDGSRLDDAKIVYGQSFAIYALAEYHLASGDARALDYAGRTFDLLRVHAADARHGGFLENLGRQWLAEPPGFGGGDRKSLDTHMHLMESFTVLYQASGSALHRRVLLELIDLIGTRMIDADSGCGLNHFDLAWNSIPAMGIQRTWNAERFGEQPAQPTQTTSYGHNVELAWLLHRALEVAGAEGQVYRGQTRGLLDHAVRHGIDREHGGIYRDGLRSTGEPIVLEKEFWQHAECLVGFLDGYQQFGDSAYLQAFDNIWRFVQRWMIVPQVGEWRTLLDRRGGVLDGNIGNPWKVSYHTGRAVLECWQRLSRLVGGAA